MSLSGFAKKRLSGVQKELSDLQAKYNAETDPKERAGILAGIEDYLWEEAILRSKPE